MSYRQQLNGIFTDIELSTLEKVVEKEYLTHFMSEMTVVERRALKSIRDKLRGQQNITTPKTTPPNEL